MPITIEATPIKIRIAQEILKTLIKYPESGLKATQLRIIGLLGGNATPSERDAVMESLRNAYLIEPYGGAGRGRGYRITIHGRSLLASYDKKHGAS